MAEYRLYCLDARSRIARRKDIEAEGDAAAIETARTLEPGHDCELWSGSRKVALIPKDGEPVPSRPAA
jgi:hypothetical protein